MNRTVIALIVALNLAAAIMFAAQIYSAASIIDVDPAPCLHPCACEEAKQDCVHGTKICNLDKKGNCVCRCIV